MSGVGGESRTGMKYEILCNLGVRTKEEVEISYTDKIGGPKTGLLVPPRTGGVK